MSGRPVPPDGSGRFHRDVWDCLGMPNNVLARVIYGARRLFRNVCECFGMFSECLGMFRNVWELFRNVWELFRSV